MNITILAAAAALNIAGPGSLSVSIDTVGPAPTYSVIVDSDTLVSPSPLGLVTDYADLATNLRPAGAVQVKDTVISYTLDRIKKKNRRQTRRKGRGAVREPAGMACRHGIRADRQ